MRASRLIAVVQDAAERVKLTGVRRHDLARAGLVQAATESAEQGG